MKSTSLLALAAVTLLVACGGETPRASSTDGEGESASSAQSTPAARNTASGVASAPDDDPCAEARFDETATFAFHEELPFRFEYPAGWDYLARTGPSQMAGSLAHVGHTGRRSSTGSIQYVFAREASSNPEGMRRIFKQSMEAITTATIGGRDVTVFANPDPRVVNAKFLYPDADGMHSASFIFGSSSESCVEERRSVRDLVLGSISVRD